MPTGSPTRCLTSPACCGKSPTGLGLACATRKAGCCGPPLAAEVFGPTTAHDAALADLEAIVHPRVRRQIEERLAALRRHSSRVQGVVVLDVPLLMQAHWDDLCDWLLLVECPEDERRRRLDARGWPVEQRAARERAWNRGYRSPPPEKTLFIEASGDEAYTLEQVSRIWDSLRRV